MTKKIYLVADRSKWDAKLKASKDEKEKEALFKKLKEALYRQYALHKAYDVRVLTTLHDELDKMAAYAALELGLPYEVILPTPLEAYTAYLDDDGFNEFMWLFYRAERSDTVDSDSADLPLSKSLEKVWEILSKKPLQV